MIRAGSLTVYIVAIHPGPVLAEDEDDEEDARPHVRSSALSMNYTHCDV